MSDIVKARLLIATVQMLLDEVEGLLDREKPAKAKAAPKQVRITDAMREQVKTLAAEGSKTNHQIAEIVGLRNGGRVSEILHGKR